MDYFLIAVVTFGLILIYTLIQSRSTWYLYFIIPIVLASGVGIYITYNTILGYPTTAKSDKKFLLLSHTVTEDHIFMWVIHDNESEPRAYQMPYTEEGHAQLAEAEQQQGKGIIIEGEFEGEFEEGEMPGFGTNKSIGAEFRLYDLDPQDLLPPKQDSPTTTHILNHNSALTDIPPWDLRNNSGP